MSAVDPVKALALYKRACTSHKRTDWRLACHALAAVVQEPQRVVTQPDHRDQPVVGERSLIQFLAKEGLRDDGGELSALDAEHWHKDQPFRRRLVRPDGRSLENVAEAAWEAGFFPDACPDWDSADNAHAVTEADLIEAIRRELAQ